MPQALPLEVGPEPVVTINFAYTTEIPWLAGHGYNTLGMTFPVIFRGKEDHIAGRFMTVLWENLYDPILTGPEELGFSKIYCELPEPRFFNNGVHCTASWLGFKFADPRLKTVEAWKAEGTVQFHQATWEDMPTQFHIVNGIRDLEVKEYVGGWVFKGVGGKDLSDQRIPR